MPITELRHRRRYKKVDLKAHAHMVSPPPQTPAPTPPAATTAGPSPPPPPKDEPTAPSQPPPQKEEQRPVVPPQQQEEDPPLPPPPRQQQTTPIIPLSKEEIRLKQMEQQKQISHRRRQQLQQSYRNLQLDETQNGEPIYFDVRIMRTGTTPQTTSTQVGQTSANIVSTANGMRQKMIPKLLLKSTSRKFRIVIDLTPPETEEVKPPSHADDDGAQSSAVLGQPLKTNMVRFFVLKKKKKKRKKGGFFHHTSSSKSSKKKWLKEEQQKKQQQQQQQEGGEQEEHEDMWFLDDDDDDESSVGSVSSFASSDDAGGGGGAGGVGKTIIGEITPNMLVVGQQQGGDLLDRGTPQTIEEVEEEEDEDDDDNGHAMSSSSPTSPLSSTASPSSGISGGASSSDATNHTPSKQHQHQQQTPPSSSSSLFALHHQNKQRRHTMTVSSHDGKEREIYVERSNFPLRYLRLLDRQNDVCRIQAFHNRSQKIRDVIFPTLDDAKRFERIVQYAKEQESLRVSDSVQQALLTPLTESSQHSTHGSRIEQSQRSNVVSTTAEASDDGYPPPPLNDETVASANADVATDTERPSSPRSPRGMMNELHNRVADRLHHHHGDRGVEEQQQVHLLIDIVSAWNLRKADIRSSDPFVVVRMGDRVVHKTKYISKTLDPIWTVRTGSLFLLSVPLQELFECVEGVAFEVKDYDSIVNGGSNDLLGIVYVPPNVLYHGRGERMEFNLQTPMWCSHKAKGKLAIRSRHATKDDIEFMTDMSSSKAPLHMMWKNQHLITPTRAKEATKTFFSRAAKIIDGEKKFNVRPRPDPLREKETHWMTKEAIERESHDRSRKWVEGGSGHLGRVFVEILGCDGLPNMDRGERFGNKTDTFIAAVFEDCLAVTDVIDDCLSPRWLPWTQRAFAFNIMHPSSPLYIGVFDYDLGSLNDHDPIGRVTVDITNLAPQTEHLLHYKIYSSSRVTRRSSYGTITIRLRVEWTDDYRAPLLTTLQVPPEVYINCKTKQDYELARYTCEGKYKEEKYSLKTISSYIEELASYQLVWIIVQDGLASVLLWRPLVTIPVTVPSWLKGGGATIPAWMTEGGKTAGAGEKAVLLLPLHSVFFFVAVTSVVERPHCIPSFFMFCFGWLMLECMKKRLRNPSPWRRCKTFRELLLTFTLQEQYTKPRTINAYENEAGIQAYMKSWEVRLTRAAKEADRRAEENRRLQEDYEKSLEEIGDQNYTLSTQDSGGISVGPLKPFLFPIQGYLRAVCEVLRVCRNIVIWEESYFSFWVTVGAFLLSFAFLFVPWAFAIRWYARVISWIFLGPWMKLFDIYYYSPLSSITDQEIYEQQQQRRLAKQLLATQAVTAARERKENAKQLRDMKRYRFGDYILSVPIFRIDRHIDKPMRHSTAKPIGKDAASEWQGAERIFVPGQQLVGDMIPKPKDAPQEKEAKKMNGLLRDHYG